MECRYNQRPVSLAAGSYHSQMYHQFLLFFLSSNGDLNLDTSLDVDDDLLDDLGRGVKAV
jgi:hypothetical protein